MEDLKRRADDSRIAQLESRVGSIEAKLDANSTTTQEIRDILGSFKVLGTIAKWVGAVVGAGFGAYQFITSFMGGPK